MRKLLKKLTYTQIIVLSFLLVILVGTLLLCLPVSSANGTFTPPLNAMFTATSATCVTGLVVYDTFTHWSLFGQIVIISLIQIGGLGFLVFISMFSVFLKKKIGVYERRLLMQAEGNIRLSGAVVLLKRIVRGTFTFEAVGAVILAFRFCPKMGLAEGIFNAIFHAVSAFCNAGFDLMGKYKQFSSLSTFAEDPVVMITIISLVVIGGIGFLVWSDIVTLKTKVKKYSLHTKITLSTTAILLIGSTLLFLLLEYNGVLKDFSFFDKIINAAFLAVSPRTAGFNTVDLSALSSGSEVITDLLMLIGGSPGSTAGGLKTTTFAVLILSTIAAARHDTHPQIFKRRLPDEALSQATAIFTIYVVVSLVAVVIVSTIEKCDITTAAFEVISAIGTVGATKGLTPTLCGASKLIIMGLMFGGRVGGLSLMLSLAEKRENIPLDRPSEKILIG
ncbi:MAG: Trk family potassium uptake protein [Clostridia bacterium]|nr:Trk family potassium uptake protein [Clostridia bacterium]